MTSNEVIRLFHLNKNMVLPIKEAREISRLIVLGYKEIEYDEAKSMLLSTIEKYGKDRPRLWYLQHVYDSIITKMRDESAENRRMKTPRKSKTHY